MNFPWVQFIGSRLEERSRPHCPRCGSPLNEPRHDPTGRVALYDCPVCPTRRLRTGAFWAVFILGEDDLWHYSDDWR